MSTRAQQKQKTRRALLDAALKLLNEERGFGSLSLREVAREAGIAPTSFYRHFNELEELGLALVDEAGVTLRQLMRQARKQIPREGSLIAASVDLFLEYLANNENQFRLLLREKTGISRQFRTAINAEINHFAMELSEDLARLGEERHRPVTNPRLVADTMVTIVFNMGADALDASPQERKELRERLIQALRFVLIGAEQAGRSTERKGTQTVSEPG